MNNKVLLEEIWVLTTDDDATAVDMHGKKYKMIAMIVNGQPLYLEKDVYLQTRYISQEDYKEIKKG